MTGPRPTSNLQCESKKYPPPKKKKLFNIFGQANYISINCCQYIASLYPHIFTNFGQFKFTVIFNEKALIFLGVLVVFNVSSFELHQVKLLWLQRQWYDEWSPIHPTSIHWIVRFGGNAGVLLRAATEAKTVPNFYRSTLADLVCLWSARESHWQCCEKLPQVTVSMCVSQRWKFWTYNVTVCITDTSCYI